MPQACDRATVYLTVNSAPSISITKEGSWFDTNGNGMTDVGDVINYTFVVTNTGNVTLTNVKVSDSKVSVLGGPLASLAPRSSDSTTFTAVYNITQEDINKVYVYNLATVRATPPVGDPVSGTSTDPTPCATCPVDPKCADCTITKLTQTPSITIVKTSVFNDDHLPKDNHAVVGETISYSFTVTNTGNVPLTNVTITDLLPGVVLEGSPIITLGVGESNSTAYRATYTLKIVDLLVRKVVNQAVVSGESPLGVKVESTAEVTDHLSTVGGVSSCAIEVFNAVSPNGDGLNDVFFIRGLECYPDNTVEIYNRWGVLVFERNGYNNTDKAFRGISEGRVTIKQSEELPVGTYYYIFKYRDSESKGHEKAGYLYLNR